MKYIIYRDNVSELRCYHVSLQLASRGTPNVPISSKIGSWGRTILGHPQLIECMGICVLSMARGSELKGSDVCLHTSFPAIMFLNSNASCSLAITYTKSRQLFMLWIPSPAVRGHVEVNSDSALANKELVLFFSLFSFFFTMALDTC